MTIAPAVRSQNYQTSKSSSNQVNSIRGRITVFPPRRHDPTLATPRHIVAVWSDAVTLCDPCAFLLGQLKRIVCYVKHSKAERGYAVLANGLVKTERGAAGALLGVFLDPLRERSPGLPDVPLAVHRVDGFIDEPARDWWYAVVRHPSLVPDSFVRPLVVLIAPCGAVFIILPIGCFSWLRWLRRDGGCFRLSDPERDSRLGDRERRRFHLESQHDARGRRVPASTSVRSDRRGR